MRWRQDILQDISKVEVSNIVGAESVSSYKENLAVDGGRNSKRKCVLDRGAVQ